LESWCSLLRERGGLLGFITLIQVVKQTLSLLEGITLRDACNEHQHQHLHVSLCVIMSTLVGWCTP